MMKLTALKIDPEFQGKIPPLTSEELDQLEKNIVSDGKVSLTGKLTSPASDLSGSHLRQ